MNLGRIMGVILSILTIAAFINKENNRENTKNTFESVGSIAEITEEGINFDSVSLDMDNNSNMEIIKYTNNQPYAIELTSSNITINCKGNSKSDEELVQKNMKINAYFAKNNNGDEAASNIRVNSKETIYIYVVNEYIGEVYPNEEVNCDYSINIQDM